MTVTKEQLTEKNVYSSFSKLLTEKLRIITSTILFFIKKLIDYNKYNTFKILFTLLIGTKARNPYTSLRIVMRLAAYDFSVFEYHA